MKFFLRSALLFALIIIGRFAKQQEVATGTAHLRPISVPVQAASLFAPHAATNGPAARPPKWRATETVSSVGVSLK